MQRHRAHMSRGMERPSTKVAAPLYSRAMRRLIQTDAYNRRLWHSTREVLLAVALTVAALVFIFVLSQPQQGPQEHAREPSQRSASK